MMSKQQVTDPKSGKTTEKVTALICTPDMDGIEMHGTGTLLGDPIEIGALSTIFDGCRGEASGRILHLSGVKSTVGHLARQELAHACLP